MVTSVTAHVRIEEFLCRGSGLCEAMSPELFALAKARHAAALQPELTDPELISLAHTVAECCPTEAIVVTETGEGTAAAR